MSRSSWAVIIILLLALIFAVQGGEYSTGDWLTLRREEREERDSVLALRGQIDSLQRVLKAVQTDPAVQERVARESFGMIRKGEFLYKLVPRDSGGGDQ